MSVSTAIIVPCRNEAGTIEELLSLMIVHLKPRDSIIVVEGGSTDGTWQVVKEFANSRESVVAIQQSGVGKFNAVLEGLRIAEQDYVMIWDADGTVSFLDNLKIYNFEEKNSFLMTGDRLRGKREKGAMRFFNLIGNWVFAISWGLIFRRTPLDSLCGTKKFPRALMEECPEWLLREDPYGDFAILATARKVGLKVHSIPVVYGARQYGQTNIHRWSGGSKLLRIVIKIVVKIKIISVTNVF